MKHILEEAAGDLLRRAEALEPVRCGVVYPCETGALQAALSAQAQGLLIPVLLGPAARLQEIAAAADLDLSGVEIIDIANDRQAAETAARMAAQHELEALMKGSLHTDELMRAILAEPDLRTGRRMSHVYHFRLPAYPKPLLVSDCALNIKPDLSTKADIVQNTIDLAHVLGNPLPKVAILSAVETVTPAIPSTLDAAALCKMADRKQITGALLDGPLAFDNAVSPEAVRIKGICSPVAGEADILIVPDLEAGNMLGKQLEYFAGAHTAGIVVGARVPLALTSRADSVLTRTVSALLVKLLAHHYRENPPAKAR